jgi:outer membrane protein assembly factor BamB
LAAVVASCASTGSDSTNEIDTDHDSYSVIKEYRRLISPTAVELHDLIRSLDAEDYRIREEATTSLIEIAEPALPILRKELSSAQSAESQHRMETAIRCIEETLYSEARPRLLSMVDKLGNSSGRDAAELLISLLARRDKAVAIKAAESLRKFKNFRFVCEKSRDLLEQSKTIKEIREYPRKAFLAKQAYLITGGEEEKRLYERLEPCLQVWPSSGHDPKNTRRSPFTGPRKPNLKWVFSGKSHEGMAPPVVGDDGTIYAGSKEKEFYALNQDGSVKWSFTADEYIADSAVICEDDTVCFSSWPHLNNPGMIYAIFPDGSIRWRELCFGPNLHLGRKNQLHVGGKRLFAFNLFGNKLWEFGPDPFEGSYLSAVNDDGIIYLVAENLYAVTADGASKWKAEVWSDSPPAIGRNGLVYVNSGGWELFAYKPDGTLCWRLKLAANGGRWLSNGGLAIAADRTIYCCCGDSKLRAVSPDGNVKWTFDVGNFLSPPAVDGNGTIYVATHLGKIFAINPDGTKAWEFKPKEFLKAPPEWTDSYPFRDLVIGINNTIYVTCDDGGLYAIGDEEVEKEENRNSGK